MAKDLFHDLVKKALEKDGWTITDDPLAVKAGGVEFYIDLGIERLVGAERDGCRIAVEIKSFLNPSAITDFYLALGQYLSYCMALEKSEDQADRQLFLAVPTQVYQEFFQKEFTRDTTKKYNVKLVVYDTDTEEIIQWIN